jgi:hypothetical protein
MSETSQKDNGPEDSAFKRLELKVGLVKFIIGTIAGRKAEES